MMDEHTNSEPIPEAASHPTAGVESSPEADAPENANGEVQQPEGESAEAAASLPPGMKWYAVHTYSGYENKARLSLIDRIRNSTLEHRFGEVLIPTESVVELRKGKRHTTTKKFYPGYMFVQMVLSDETFHLVKSTPKITGFLGGTKPVAVRDSEIAGINRQMTEGAIKPRPRIAFEEGEDVRVIDGPFSNFTGVVEEVRPEKQKVRVLVSIFGRATPVELDFAQVEKSE